MACLSPYVLFLSAAPFSTLPISFPASLPPLPSSPQHLHRTLCPGQPLIIFTHQNVDQLHFMRIGNHKFCSAWPAPRAVLAPSTVSPLLGKCGILSSRQIKEVKDKYLFQKSVINKLKHIYCLNQPLFFPLSNREIAGHAALFFFQDAGTLSSHYELPDIHGQED